MLSQPWKVTLHLRFLIGNYLLGRVRTIFEISNLPDPVLQDEVARTYSSPTHALAIARHPRMVPRLLHRHSDHTRLLVLLFPRLPRPQAEVLKVAEPPGGQPTGARLRRRHRLDESKDERDVARDAFPLELARGLDALPRAGELDEDARARHAFRLVHCDDAPRAAPP